MTNVVQLPNPYFPDPDNDKAIALGKLYFGVADADPTVLANRISVTLVQEDGTNVVIAAASQPLRTGMGGTVMYAGSPVSAIEVSTNFSMTVLREDDTQAYYFPDAGIPDLIDNIQDSSYTYLTSVSGTNIIVGTATPNPGAYAVGQRFQFIPANTNTGSTTLNISGLGAGQVQLKGAALAGDELVQNVPVEVMVTAATPVFEIIGNGAFILEQAIDTVAIPTGTQMLFMQNAAPTGWTFVSANNDSVILNTATEADGGGTGGSWTISGISVDGTILSDANIDHDHFTMHSASATVEASSTTKPFAINNTLGGDSDYRAGYDSTNTAAANRFPTSGVEGGDVATRTEHTHALSVLDTWRPVYVKCITCQKD